MSEVTGFHITKGHVIAGGVGLLAGVLGTLGFTKWLPEYQERVARRQGAIMAEEFAKRTGFQYNQTQGNDPTIRYTSDKGKNDPMDLYEIKNALNEIKNTLNVNQARLDDLERRLRKYKGEEE